MATCLWTTLQNILALFTDDASGRSSGHNYILKTFQRGVWGARKISACYLVLVRGMVKMIVSFVSLSELAHEILAQMLFEGCGMLPDCFRIVQNVKTQNRFVAIDSFVSKNNYILYCIFVELPQGGDLASANSIYHFGALFVFTSGFGSRLLPDRFQTRF